MDIKYNDVYQPFFKTQKRFVLLLGSAGSGKSVAAKQKIIMRCLDEAGLRVLITRKFRSSIKESVFQELKISISEYGLTDFVKVNETNMSFTFGNGSQIITSGLDDVEKLKSLAPVGCIWCEEASELEYSDVTQLNLRLRGGNGLYRQLIMTFNPISELSFLKTEFFDKPSESIFILKTTVYDNQFVEEEYIKEIEERYKDDKNTYRIYVLGEWGRVISGREFYASFDYTKHTKDKIPFYTNECIHLSFDFNSTPYMTAIVAQIFLVDDVWNVNILDELIMKSPKNTTEATCDEFLNRYEGSIIPPLFIYGDASGRSRSPLNNLHNYEVIETVLQKYVSASSIRVPKTNPSILKRRQFINKLLSGGYNIKITIDKKCEHTIQDMENVDEGIDGRKVKKRERDKETGAVYEKYGHTSDTLDYLLVEAFKGYFENYSYAKDR
jgi:phage terminase large subunit